MPRSMRMQSDSPCWAGLSKAVNVTRCVGSPFALDATVDWIRQQAAERSNALELNALVQSVVATENCEAVAADVAAGIAGLDASDALATPFLAIGIEDEIAEHLRHCRSRWGIPYFVVRELEGFSPVIERLRSMDLRDIEPLERAHIP